MGRLLAMMVTNSDYGITIADDNAIDLVAKLDASEWLLGCKP